MNQIIQFLVTELNRSADLIVKNNGTVLRVGKTYHARFIVRMMFVTMAAATVVARFLAVCHLLFAQRVEALVARLSDDVVNLGSARVKLKLSWGLTMIRADDTVDSAIGRADAAMYMAKADQRSER